MDVDLRELSPGIHRIEAIVDGQRFGYHILETPRGLAVVDTGASGFPEEIYGEFIGRTDYDFDDINLAILTHADADHHGGNSELRELADGLTFVAHRDDVPLIEDEAEVMWRRYRRFEEQGVEYSDELLNGLSDMIGGFERVDIHLRGGEHFAVADRIINVLHTPGHSRGHLMLYDADYEVIIGADGFFGRGVRDVDRGFIQPPPYLYYPEYVDTIGVVDALDVATLSFTHYDIMTDDEIDEFVAESLAFTDEFEAALLNAIEDRVQATLEELIDEIVERMGSFGLRPNLAYPVTAHLSDLEKRGVITATAKNEVDAWELTD